MNNPNHLGPHYFCCLLD
uniref:Uncharacterized protein n=1 Tax=Arundo donax TaxID=35708 RepID=A0A0A8YJ17_ARUDO